MLSPLCSGAYALRPSKYVDKRVFASSFHIFRSLFHSFLLFRFLVGGFALVFIYLLFLCLIVPNIVLTPLSLRIYRSRDELASMPIRAHSTSALASAERADAIHHAASDLLPTLAPATVPLAATSGSTPPHVVLTPAASAKQTSPRTLLHMRAISATTLNVSTDRDKITPLGNSGSGTATATGTGSCGGGGAVLPPMLQLRRTDRSDSHSTQSEVTCMNNNIDRTRFEC